MIVDPDTWGLGDKRRIDGSRFPPQVLARVDDAQGGRFCLECRRGEWAKPTDVPLELDHKRPLARGGDNHWSNLQWLCRWHNRKKKGGALSGKPLTPPWAK